MSKTKKISLFLGPTLFILSLIPYGGLTLNIRVALGTLFWMSSWWVGMPVSPAITAFLPVVVNAIFSLTTMSGIISAYSAELVFLLAGANVITIAWERTGVDKAIAARTLSIVGTSVKQQVAIWFLLATFLSAFLPNTVVAAIFCSIAMSMLKFVGEGDVKNSSSASLILMAIVWGANNGGMLTPLGGAMNLVTISHIEKLIQGEFLYTDWIVRILPFGIVTTGITLVMLMSYKNDRKNLEGSRDYFRDLVHEFGSMSPAGKISLWLFIVAVLLSFTRQLYQGWLPNLRPGFVFLILGLVVFFIKDEEGKQIVTWEIAEKNMMWGMFFLFAGGNALGTLINNSGAAELFAEVISNMEIHSTFVLILIIVTLNVVLSDVVNNTACAAVTIPIIISTVRGLGLPIFPFLWIATVSYNISYTLPTSIRAIPIGYGLEPMFMFKKGLVISVVVVLAVSGLGWLLIEYWPAFGQLTM